MKKLVIYYSFEGNTKLVAEAIASEINAEIMELETQNQMRGHSFMKYFWGGKQVLMQEKPELLPFSKNIDKYDLLLIGSPIWAWSFAPPLNSLLEKVVIKNKKIALFCSHGGGPKKAIDKFAEKLKGNEIIGQIDFQEPLSKDTEANLKKAKEWAKEIIKKYN